MRHFLMVWSIAFLPTAAIAQHKNGVVVAVSQPGAEAGLSMLQKGGNAVDAAIATALAMAVTHPAAGNIGGGGFMLIQPPAGEAVVIDYRETAPAVATKTMYPPNASIYGHRAVGVPGTLRGLELAHKKFSKLPWKTLVSPAVILAEQGFVLDRHHATSLNNILQSSKDFAELQRVFAKPDGSPWKAGDKLVQPDLAKTMRVVAEQGPDAFYKGPIADLIVAEMQAGQGLITREDLAGYQAAQRVPIRGQYRGFEVLAPPPPSSGGIALIEMLGILEHFDLKKHDRFSAPTLHLMAEAMRRAYRDRAQHLGDPAFTKIPEFLTSKPHLQEWARSIDLTKATKSETLAGEIKLAPESESTTHFSAIDKEGWAVANTYTLEQSYGSRVVVRGGGFLLNDEMMDFNWRPGVTDRKGTIGTEPNQIAPGKRMLSSQTPTIVWKDGKVLLVTGSPGGRTIINTTLNVLVSVLDYDMPIQKAIDGPRLHHQWFPDQIRFEGTESHAKAVAGLKALGHEVLWHRQGDAHSIWVDRVGGTFVGAADKRLSGHVAGY